MGDGAGGEGFYVADFGAFIFLVPAGEGGEEEEAEEGEDDGDDAGNLVSIDVVVGWKEISVDLHKIWEYYTIFER